MKAKFRLILSLVLAMVIFASCTKDANNGKKTDDNTNGKTETSTSDNTGTGEVTLKVLVPGFDEGYLKDQLSSAIEKYESENKNVKIEVVSAGWEELNSKVVQLYQAKQSPDIMLLGSRSLKQFKELGILENLDSYITDEIQKERVSNVMDTGKIDGGQYGIPMAFSSRALFYRKDLIQAPPTTWDELLEISEKVAKENNMKGFAFPTDIQSGTDELLNFFYQGGGRIVDENGNFVIDSPENIETLTFLSKFKDIIPDPVSTKRDEQSKMFINGDLAMFVSGAWEIPNLDEANAEYGIAKLPKGKQESVTLVTDSYVMSSISEHKDEAFKFIEFMINPEIQKTVTDAYNWFPVTKAEESRDRYKEENMKPFMEIIPNGIPEPHVPNWDEFNKSFTIAVQKA